MNKFLLFLFASVAFGQTAFRYDPTFFTTPGTTPSGASAPMFTVPNSIIAVCTNSGCSSLATTYTSSTAGTACPSNAPVVLSAGGACRATSGAIGQFGFWMLPGAYYYTVTTPNGQFFGPYAFTVGGSGGGGSSSWATLNPGTNTLGPFLVGNGSSFGPVGGGTVNANLLNGVALASLGTGVLKNTTGTGVPSLAGSSDVVSLFTGCSGSMYLGADGACHAAAGSGTVTSVAITIPNWLSVAGSPITTAGTFTITPATGQTSHQVIGTCGSGTTFGPCALVASDIPTLNQNTSGNAATATALASTPSQCPGGQVATGIASSGAANCTVTVNNINVQASSAPVGTRNTINFIPGSGITQPVVDTGTVVNISTSIDTSIIPTKPALQTGAALLVTTTSSSATAYTATMSPTLIALTTGMLVNWKVSTSCTGGTATTINIDTLGVKSIKQADGSTDPASAQCANGLLVPLWYDGTVFRIMTAVSTSGGSAVSVLFWPFGQMQESAAVVTPALGSANKTIFLEVMIPSPGVVLANLSAYPNASAPGHVAFAIYDSTCTLLANGTSATVNASSNTATNFAFSPSLSLSGGKYFIAYTGDTTTMQLYSPGAGYMTDLSNVGESSGNYHIFTGTASTGTTTLTFPGTCGTRSLHATGGLTAYPALALR